MSRVSMKQSQEHTLMRHDTQRYLLSTPHYIIKSAEKTFELYQSATDETLKAQLLSIIDINRQAYLEQLEIALLFDETGKDESQDPLKIRMHHWLKNVHIFNLHYMDVVAHAIKHTRTIPLKDLIISSLQENTAIEDLKLLLKNLISNFSFGSIAFVMDFVKTNYPESLDDFKVLLTESSMNQRNFLNLLLKPYYTRYPEKYSTILSYMNIKDVSFRTIINLQSGRFKDGNFSQYEVDRFNLRFSYLFESGIFDNDISLTDDGSIIPEPQPNEENTIAYLYHGFETEIEKQLLLDMIKKRLNFIKK